MALNINGTTGISGVDGSASAPALQGTDSNTGINFASDTVNINTGGTTRATVDSSGNLNIPDNGKIQLGTGNDLNILHTGSASEINNTTNTELQIKNLGNNGILLKNENAYPIIFQTSAAERMRVTQNANGSSALYINQTSEVSGANSNLVVNNAIACVSGSNFRSMYMSGSGILYWWNGTNQPYISTGGVFTDASDVSLKKDITDLTYGIDVLKNLKPRKYKMKADDKEQIGFIAQEVETAVPEVVDTSETPNGDQHKGIAYGHLTAVLTKALQEAVAKIETLETKVAALEAG